MPKVSVIIPVYNGEAYLRQCLDSVCAQTLEEIEIICVDDGSTDSSWKILEGYWETDERFRLLRHSENLGLPAARNNGLAQAQGKYVIFWDCDDIFEPNALELLYQRAEETEAEICVCNNDFHDHTTGKRYPESAPLNPKRIPEGDTFNRFTNPEHILSFSAVYIWNKLFLRTFLIENDIKTPNFRYAEDRPVTFLTLCLASKITTVNKVLIHYRWNNPDSQVGNKYQFVSESIRALIFTVDQLIERDIVPTESLGKRALQILRSDLQNAVTEEDFINAYQLCMEGTPNLLQKCNIVEREPGYYYGAADDEYVKHLLHDKPGDLMAFMMRDLWQRNRVNAAKRRGLSANLKIKKEELKTKKEELKAKKEELRTKKEELKAKKEELKSTKAEFKAELKAVRAELKATKAELRRTKGDLEALRSSPSYRLGHALLYIPWKIRELFRRITQK